jgi:hypothetical protein
MDERHRWAGRGAHPGGATTASARISGSPRPRNRHAAPGGASTHRGASAVAHGHDVLVVRDDDVRRLRGTDRATTKPRTDAGAIPANVSENMRPGAELLPGTGPYRK